MILEVVVGDGDVGRVFGHIDQAIGRIRQVTMIHPNIGGAMDVNGVAVGAAPEFLKTGRSENVLVPAGGDNIVNMDAVDDDVGDVLDSDLGGAHEVDVCAAPVNGLEARHDELALNLDGHVLGEDDPERLRPGDAVAQRAGAGVAGIVRVRGDDVELSVLAPNGVLTESNRARCERLAMALPVGVASPAVVDVVPGRGA